MPANDVTWSIAFLITVATFLKQKDGPQNTKKFEKKEVFTFSCCSFSFADLDCLLLVFPDLSSTKSE